MDAIDEFADHLLRIARASPNTVRGYVSDLRQLAGWLSSAGKALDEADRDDLRGFLASRFAHDQPATLSRKQSSLRAFYDHRVRMGRLDDSPARALVRPKRRRSLPNVVTVDDVFALLRTPSDKTAAGLRDRCAFELLYGAGLRVSELVGLDLEDLLDGVSAVRVLGKGGKERLVPLVAKAREATLRYLERRGELDLEAATEFLVLITALLELKSRLMLPGEEPEQIELDPGEAAEELLARLLDAHRFRSAAADLLARLADQEGHRFRQSPLPLELRRASLREARVSYDPAVLGAAVGELLRQPQPVDTSHLTVPKVSLAERLARLRELLRRGSFKFDEAVGRADRVTVAVTLFAVLELYKQGELTWRQDEPFGEIEINALQPASQAASESARPATVKLSA